MKKQNTIHWKEFKMPIVVMLLLVLIAYGVSAWSKGLNQDITEYYRFDELSGSSARDAVNGTYNGTLITPAGFPITKGFPGVSKTSFNFSATADGTSGSYVNITRSNFDCVDLNCSVSLWANWSANSARGIWFLGNGSAYVLVNTNSGKVTVQVFNQSAKTATVTSPQVYNNSMYQHIVGVLNKTSLLLYINNTFINQVALNGTVLAYQNPPSQFIGASGPSTGTPMDFFQGAMDEVAVYNRTLNATEVSELFNAGTGNPFGSGLITNISLIAPPNNSIIAHNNVTFIGNTNGTSPSSNTTLYVFHQNGSVTFIYNNLTSDNIAPVWNLSLAGADYFYSMRSCANSSDGYFSCYTSENKSFAVGFAVLGEFWKNATGEGDSALFQINITVPDGKTIESAHLQYNNTNYNAMVDQIAGQNYSLSRTINIDNLLTSTAIPFFWNITLASTPGTFVSNVHTQQVGILTFSLGTAGACGVNTDLILNYSIKDEDLNTYLNGLPSSANLSVGLDLTTIGTNTLIAQYNHTFYILNATTPAQVCITTGIINQSSYRLDVSATYIATDHVQEYHNIQNHTLTNNTIFRDIPLLDLLTTRAQQFLITYKDANFIPVAEALIQIDRQYLGDGVFRTVEIPKTDSDGRTIASFVLNDEVYTIYVYKNGVLLATFQNVRAFCSNTATGDCRINLNAQTTGTQALTTNNYLNISYALDYIQATRTVTFYFTTTDGTTKFIELNVTKFDPYLNQSLCYTSITGSSGLLNCPISASVGNITIQANVYADHTFLTNAIFNLNINQQQARSVGIYVLVFLLIVSIPLLAFSSMVGTLIFFIVGLILAGFLALLDFGGYVGATSAFMWFVIAAGVLIWKLTHRED